MGTDGGKEGPLLAKKKKGAGTSKHYLDTGTSRKRYRE
jgi:hypothetical protein